MGSLWAEVEREVQHYTISGSSSEEADEHARYPAVQPCVCRGSWPVVGVHVSVCIGACALRVAGRLVQGYKN